MSFLKRKVPNPSIDDKSIFTLSITIMPDPARITLADVAARAGVSAMTVSRALRGSTDVSAATRTRLRQIARSMGYRPDPALSSLNYYRTGKRLKSDYGTLALLTSHPTPDGWQVSGFYREVARGASTRAEELGFRLEPYWLGPKAGGGARHHRILDARGIRGLIVMPVKESGTMLEFNFSRFCTVAIGQSLGNPGHHFVAPRHFTNMNLALDALESRGARRIALALSLDDDRRSSSQWLGAYLRCRMHRPWPEPLLHANGDANAIAAWLRKVQPDALLAHTMETASLALNHLCLRVPQDLQFALLDVGEHTAGISGVNQRGFELGATAVSTLHGLILEGKVGLPPWRRAVLVEGVWHQDKSTRQPKPTA